MFVFAADAQSILELPLLGLARVDAGEAAERITGARS